MSTPKNRCLILIVHGSRDPRWCYPFESHTKSLQMDCGATSVKLAYMEIARPTLLEAATAAVNEGATEVFVLPLFMAGGGHVDHDIPVLVDEVGKTFPELSVLMLPAIGEHPAVVRAIKDIAKDLLAFNG
ncbi:MAG: CbiX/SirB N-terminal domain-containing protein [Candidatus Margulisiibacteriota bacterium]